MSRNNLYRITTFACFVAILTACSVGGSGGPDPSPASSQNNDAPKEPVELVLQNASGGWNTKEETYFEKEFAEPIKKKFPHITVTFRKGALDPDVIASKPQLDLIVASPSYYFKNIRDYNLQYNIEPLVKKYGFDLNRLEPGALAMVRNMAGGALHGLPLYTATDGGVYYNKDLFDKFGVPYPKDGQTWDELYGIAGKLTRTEGGVKYRGFTASPNHYMIRNQLSVNLVDPKTNAVNFNTDQVKELLTNLVRFYQLPGYDADANLLKVNGQLNLFVKDRTAAMYVSSGLLNPLTEEQLQGMNWDLFSHPAWPGKPGLSAQPYPDSIYVSGTSKHPEEAFQVIEYLLSDEFQTDKAERGIFISSLKSDKLAQAFGSQIPMFKGKNVQALVPKKPAPASPWGPEYSNAAVMLGSGMMTTLVVNGKDLNTALREAEEQMVKSIAEARKN